MRLVLDTNVVLSGLLWRSHPRRLLDLAKEDAVSLYTSSALLDELADVLAREKWTAMLATRQTHAAYLMQRYGVLHMHDAKRWTQAVAASTPKPKAHARTGARR